LGAIVCGRNILGHWGTKDKLAQNITFRDLMYINVETIISEWRQLQQLMLSKQVTQHTNRNTPHTGYNSLYVHAMLQY